LSKVEHTFSPNNIKNMSDEELLHFARKASVIKIPASDEETESYYIEKISEAIDGMVEYHEKNIEELGKKHIHNFVNKALNQYIPAKLMAKGTALYISTLVP